MQCGLPEPVIILQICSDSVAAKTFCSFDMLSTRPEALRFEGEGEAHSFVPITIRVFSWPLQSHVKYFILSSCCPDWAVFV